MRVANVNLYEAMEEWRFHHVKASEWVVAFYTEKTKRVAYAAGRPGTISELERAATKGDKDFASMVMSNFHQLGKKDNTYYLLWQIAKLVPVCNNPFCEYCLKHNLTGKDRLPTDGGM